MEFGLSTHLFINERLSPHILDRILSAGFRKMEVFAARQHFDYQDRNHVLDVSQWFGDHALGLHSLHAPAYADFDWGRTGAPAISLAHLEKRRRIDAMDEIKRVLEVAERLPFRYLVLHLGLPEEQYDLRKFDAALTSIEHLKIFAKERGVGILLENTPNELGTPERLVQFIQYSRLDDLQVCFDTGHAHMSGGVRSAFQTLKQRIALTHVHDNHREKDEHLYPFEGGIDWERTVRDFRSVDREFPLLFELRHYGPGPVGFDHLRDVMKKMEAIH